MIQKDKTLPFNLVTAADANLLSNLSPNLLMGTWCTHSNVNNPISKDEVALIAAPWGLETGHTKLAESEIMQLTDNLLSKLIVKLNSAHDVSYDRRAWEIILGPWLKYFVGYIYRRSSTLHEVLKSHEILSVKCFTFQPSKVDIQDTNDFIAKTMDPVWQSMVDAILINVISKKSTYVELIPPPVEEPTPLTHEKLHRASLNSVIKYIFSQGLERAATSKLLNLIPQKYHLQATYLPILVEIRLQILLGQIPKIRWLASKNSQQNTSTEHSIRQILHDDNDLQNLPIVEACINEALIHLFPTCYLEGFECLLHSVGRANLPKNPKVIFTSNSYEVDEVFKVWTGLETQRGAKYIVGQHGNNYGTVHNQNTPEQLTPDVFLSWGWVGDFSNTRPAFNLKSSGRRQVSTQGEGILLIQDWLIHPTHPRDTDLEFEQNLQEQMNLIDSLPFETRKTITVRLHYTVANSTFNIIGAWKGAMERYPEITLDLGTTPIRELISRHALVIHCYDSTGMLETFAENIPSIAFIPGGLEHLNDAARIRFSALKEAGLLYVSSKLAADALSQIYPNVKEWWESEKVVEEREIFVNSYSKISNHPARELAKILRTVSSLGY